MTHAQTKIARSRFTLPFALLYGVGIWALANMGQERWWVQFACFILSVGLMAELNNANLLIRIYSRIVSTAFIVLTCAAAFLFPSLQGSVSQVLFIASLLILYRGYQDKDSMGTAFYAFLLIGLASLGQVHILCLVPVLWVVMAFFIYSLSVRTFMASLLGLLIPYWALLAWIVTLGGNDFQPWAAHFLALGNFAFPFDYLTLTLPQILLFFFLILLGTTGCIHYLRTSFYDKIRVRQIFYSFIFIGTATMLMLAVQPQHYDLLIRVMIVTVSPLIGHFLALTDTKLTNIYFHVILALAIVITCISLWMSSSIF